MAMALLAHHLAHRGGEAYVHSVGTIGWGGPATAHAVEVLSRRGVDLSEHESRRIATSHVLEADLVLGMTRDHVNGVMIHDPAAVDRSFVIGELVRLGDRIGPRRSGQSVREWAAEVAALRPPKRPPGQASDEIPDPVGEGEAVYEATAERLDGLCARISELLLP